MKIINVHRRVTVNELNDGFSSSTKGDSMPTLSCELILSHDKVMAQSDSWWYYKGETNG